MVRKFVGVDCERLDSTERSVRSDTSYTHRAYFMDADRGLKSASSTAHIVHFSGGARNADAARLEVIAEQT